MKQVTLQEYIDTIGASNLAKTLRTSRQNVHAWKNFRAAPRLEVAYKMILLSNGMLNLDAIYLPFLQKKLKGKKFKIGDGRVPAQLEFKF